jgi:hypothetical protein
MRKRNLLRLVLPILLWTFLAAGNVLAATYYVDFASGADTNAGTSTTAPWKHAPGMTGCSNTCSSTTLSGGDTLTFKGGVTWTSSFPWNLKGGSSSAITYTTDHTWFAGTSYAQPTFDDGHADPGANGMISASNVGFITVNDLQFVNCGTAEVANSDKCLVWENTHDITITNSTFATESWIGNYFIFDSPGSYSNFTFTGNDFSHNSGAMWFASAQANTSEHNVTYKQNTFHDYTSQIGGGVHGDGAWHYFSVPAGDGTQFVDQVTFCDNRFYGDFRNSFAGGGAMTAFFFTEGGFSGVICNNDMSFTPVQASMFDSLIVISANANPKATGVQIYNNSLVNVGTNAMSAGMRLDSDTANMTVKNNIISGMQYALYIHNTTGTPVGFVSDYNLLNPTGGLDWLESIESYAQWKALGFDTHGALGVNPDFVAAPGNEQLSASSPALSMGAGTNLTSLSIPVLDADLDGVPRPGSGAWDIGAYQAGGAAGSTPPPASSLLPPTNLSVSVH